MNDSTSITTPTAVGLSHVAVNTADLRRFRRFYEGTSVCRWA